MEATYEAYDRHLYDYCREGLEHCGFHSANLPERSTLLPSVIQIKSWRRSGAAAAATTKDPSKHRAATHEPLRP